MAVEKFVLQLKQEELPPAISQEEIADIEKGVTEFVKLLTDEVAKEEKLFTVKRILKVGSFYEKTKVGNPDEFDFLLELDGTFEVWKGCEHNPCSAHVKIVAPVCTNKTELLSVRAISSEGHLVAGATYRQWKHYVERVITRLQKNSLGRIQCKMGHLTTIQKIWGNGPNAELCLGWHGEKEYFDVGVDLSICIPCTDELVEMWQSELIPLDFSVVPRPVLVVPSLFRKRLLGDCRLGYIRRDGQAESAEACWKISTTPIEVYKMRNIPENYRLCYLVLKWMCKQRKYSEYGDSMLTLSSYMLKNAVLCCQARSEQKEAANCLEEVFKHLSASVDNNCLPAYFMPNANLWRYVDHEAAPPREILGLLRDFLFKELKESSQESFNFHHARARIRVLQRQFEMIECYALATIQKPMLTLPKPPE